MRVRDLGQMLYRDAWAVQEDAHARVLAGEAEELLFVEHPPVITYGRRDGCEKNLLATEAQLKSMGVDLVKSDRGGDITLHAPGQIVCYPIVRLADHHLSVGGYVHTLERIVIETLGGFGLLAATDPKAVGVWVNDAGQQAKICAIGVRIRKGVSLHGLALNVSTDLDLFDLIVPCGLQGRTVTSLSRLLGEHAPSVSEVRTSLTQRLLAALAPGAKGREDIV